MTSTKRLLSPQDVPPYLEERIDGRSEFLITVDHAANRIPACLGDLGVSASERERHIAWDIGALGIARGVSERLDATVIASNYSRLVIDCNRDPTVPSSIPTISEYTPVPGNEGLSVSDRRLRIEEIFTPYQQRIAELLDLRSRAGRPTILVCQHSMTNVYKGSSRAMHAAILYNRDRRYAGAVLDALRAEPGLVVADNEPYFVSDDTDYTVPVHAERRGLLHVEIEVRQDLVATESGQELWADRIARALVSARRALLGDG
jgi:predicted N-formylglutamate amidohydrolase